MSMEIKKLTPDMSNGYIEFFEKRGLISGDINQGCYCVWHHWTLEHENMRSILPRDKQPTVKKDYAIQLIKDGKLNGFVAFQDNKMVGFCNVDNKNNYYRLSRINNPTSWLGLDGDNNILSIVCFVIDVNLRGKGIATALLKEVIKYAMNNGFDYIESYPSALEFKVSNCCGQISMYEKEGFSIINNTNEEVVVRKRLI